MFCVFYQNNKVGGKKQKLIVFASKPAHLIYSLSLLMALHTIYCAYSLQLEASWTTLLGTFYGSWTLEFRKALWSTPSFASALVQIPLVSCCCSVTKSCPTLCDPIDCSTWSSPVLHYLLKFAQIHVHWVSDAISPSHSLSPLSPPALNLSLHQGLFSKLALHVRWSNHWSISINPSNEYSELISFRIDWFDLLAVQGTLKSLLQHHSSKASILWCSAFFTVQLSHQYMTTGKTMKWSDVNWSRSVVSDSLRPRGL